MAYGFKFSKSAIKYLGFIVFSFQKGTNSRTVIWDILWDWMENLNNVNDSVNECLLAAASRFCEKSSGAIPCVRCSLCQDTTVWMGSVHTHERGRELPSPTARAVHSSRHWPSKERETVLGLWSRGWLCLRVMVDLEGLEFKGQVGWREGNSKR